jgi:Flp pilus assembly protein CpaB
LRACSSAAQPIDPAGPKGVRRHSASREADRPGVKKLVRVSVAADLDYRREANRAEHQPIRRLTILKPGHRDFLQTVLAQGTRALTIPVAGAAGGTGMIFPGDHVDAMLTQTFENDDAPLTRRPVSETGVANRRVLAINLGTKPGAGTISFPNRPRRPVSRKTSASRSWPCAASVSPGSLRPR